MRAAHRWFSADSKWQCSIDAAPKFETGANFIEVAVPIIAALDLGRPALPVVVIAHVEDAVAKGRALPAGPIDRAKPLLDALHDNRHRGPFYRELDTIAPLPDDDARHVSGLAVEVTSSSRPSVQYTLASRLSISGRCLGKAAVDVVAPNDVPGSRAEHSGVVKARQAYASAVRDATEGMIISNPCVLVIRHKPGRDEDNTWRTWVGSLLATSKWAADMWGDTRPFRDWKPMAIASLSDPGIECEVVYEIWGH